MNNTKEHQKLVDDLLFAFGSQPDIRAWPRPVGVAQTLDGKRIITYGIKGETDIQGIIAPTGRMLCIEAKTGSGKLSKDQRNYRAMVLKFGALYIEARSVEQALADYYRLR